MAHFNLEEQEQIAKVQYFWKDWGIYLIIIAVVLVLGYIGSSTYNWYQGSQAQKAAVLYDNFSTAVNNQNNKQAYQITDDLISNLPSTEYAAMASLQSAKIAFTTKDYPMATKYLSWAKDNAKDKSLQSIATLRLASVDIDQQKFDEARKLLLTKHDLAFDGLFYEARGDMYIAMGDLNKARDAYKEGLQKAANDPSTGQAIQMKLDIIGG